MKIDGGFITEISESELYRYYLDREMFEIMSFTDYMDSFRRSGCNVIIDEQETNMSEEAARFVIDVLDNEIQKVSKGKNPNANEYLQEAIYLIERNTIIG